MAEAYGSLVHPMYAAMRDNIRAFTGLGWRRQNNEPGVLSLNRPDRFRTPAGQDLTPVRDGTGRVTGLSLSAGRIRDISFTRR